MLRQIAARVITGTLLALPACVGASETSDAFDRLDKDSNGVVTADEIQADRLRLFQRMLRTSDKNGDGKISLSEYTSSLNPPAAADSSSTTRYPRGQSGRRPSMMQSDTGALFGRLDQDKSGGISRDEAPARMKERFGRIDTNRDGQISRGEFRVASSMRAAGQMSQRIKQLDKNNDGAISQTEAQGFLKTRFKQLDADRDGQITVKEMQAAFAKYRTQQPSQQNRKQR